MQGGADRCRRLAALLVLAAALVAGCGQTQNEIAVPTPTVNEPGAPTAAVNQPTADPRVPPTQLPQHGSD